MFKKGSDRLAGGEKVSAENLKVSGCALESAFQGDRGAGYDTSASSK